MSVRQIYSDFDAQGGVRLGTLITIRWLGVAGQFFALALVGFGLGFNVRPDITVPLVASSALLNLWFAVRADTNARLADGTATAHLAFDLVHLAALLFVTGGLANPFSVLLLAPTTVSATILGRWHTYMLIGLTVCLISALTITDFPLPWDGAPPKVDPLFMLALWISLCFTMIFLAVYMARIGRESRLRSRALVATQLALEQEQKLAALGALAAAAAHELGTPIGTIMLVVRELLDTWDGDTTTQTDLELVLEEVTRCRAILSELRDYKKAGTDNHFEASPVSAVLREAAAPHERRGIAIKFDVAPDANFEVLRAPELIHSIRSIVENAVGFARRQVIVSGQLDGDKLKIIIDDDGPGFDPQILKRIGEPYLTTRRPKAGRDGGLGLGLFIAKSLLTRLGAKVDFGTAPIGGARTEIWLPKPSEDQLANTLLTPASDPNDPVVTPEKE